MRDYVVLINLQYQMSVSDILYVFIWQAYSLSYFTVSLYGLPTRYYAFQSFSLWSSQIRTVLERGSYIVLVRPPLYLSTQIQTVLNDGAEFR